LIKCFDFGKVGILKLRALGMANDGSFSRAFAAKIDEIELRALRAGTNLTAVCRAIKISRSTPDRWRRKLPRTIKLLDKMEAEVVSKEREKERLASA
jgi:transposase-like protein